MIVYANDQSAPAIVLARRDDGVEDHAIFWQRPAHPVLRYVVDTSDAAGLRLHSDVLELLDSDGVPRLRVAPPHVVDRAGRAKEAHLELQGCAADRSSKPPYGRPVTRPCRQVRCECELRVTWRDDDLEYPLVVDPVWQTTGAMITARTSFALVRIGDGRVVAAGGQQSTFALKSVEIWDPASGTWTAGPQMAARRIGFPAIHRLGSNLQGDRILVIGGDGEGVLPETEWLDTSAWVWTAGPPMLEGRHLHTATLLADGRTVVVVGGHLKKSAERLDIEATGAEWQAAADLSEVRTYHTATLLNNGQLIVIGGWYSSPSLASTEIYDAVTNTWTPGADLEVARGYHTATKLADGRVLVAGGRNGVFGYLSSVELLSPDGKSRDLHAVAGMVMTRSEHTATLLPNGAVMVAGGFDSSDNLAPVTAEILGRDLDGSWVSTATMKAPHATHSMVVLDDGVLVAGRSEIAETWRLVPPPAECVHGVECSTGVCSDGVCCASECGGPCRACTATAKGSGVDGTCGPRAVLGCSGNLTCDEHDACKVSCTTDDDCVAPFVCRAKDGACVEVGVNECTLDGLGEALPDGGVRPCHSYRCLDGSCVTACRGDEHCAPGAGCTSDGRCLQEGATAGSGCGCTQVAAAPMTWMAMLAGIASLGLRHRKGRRSSVAARAGKPPT